MRDTEIIESLLGRPAPGPAGPSLAHVAGRRVLVTGAGGSIGRELARQCAALGCARLALLDHSAPALFDVDALIAAAAPGLERQEILCDVRNRAAVTRWMDRERPDIVLHAAAIKHIDLVERHVSEGALTNLIGARIVAEAAAAVGAALTLISTDKAAQPTSAMGMSKRLAEWAVLDLDGPDGLGKFSAVRFGNVFGSSGSVATIFREQIARGGPVTVTDEAMERYFMTGAEAVRLVLAAAGARIERGAGKPCMFTLDMGRPVKIIDLARAMIRRYADDPHAVRIEFIGARPGESFTERLVDDDETIAGSPMPGVRELAFRRVRPPLEPAFFERVERWALAGEDEAVRRLMREALDVGRPARLSLTA